MALMACDVKSYCGLGRFALKWGRYVIVWYIADGRLLGWFHGCGLVSKAVS